MKHVIDIRHLLRGWSLPGQTDIARCEEAAHAARGHLAGRLEGGEVLPTPRQLRPAASRSEQVLLLAGAALVVVVAPVALFVLARGGGEQGGTATALVGAPLPPASRAATSAPTVGAPSSVEATVTADPSTPTPLLDRGSCDEIHGTEYRSAQEREWFRTNCLVSPEEGEEAAAAPEDAASPGSTEPQPPPAHTPNPPPPGVDGSLEQAAITIAIEWLASGVPYSYSATPESCNVASAGDSWFVTCVARLAGCQQLFCAATFCISVDKASGAVQGSAC